LKLKTKVLGIIGGKLAEMWYERKSVRNRIQDLEMSNMHESISQCEAMLDEHEARSPSNFSEAVRERECLKNLT